MLAEISAHLEDVLTDELAASSDRDEAERCALARLGDVEDLISSWNARCTRLRRRVRRRVAVIVIAAGISVSLSAAQHASGRNPHHPTPAIHPVPHLTRHDQGSKVLINPLHERSSPER